MEIEIRLNVFIMMAACLILALSPAGTMATAPPSHGGYLGGWGMNPNAWTQTSGSFSTWGLYDPAYQGGGASWVVGWNPTTYISYAPITLELWIEMYMLLTYQYTSYQWHRLGNSAESVVFYIQGTTQSNNDLHVRLLPAEDPLTHLYFREDIFGRTGSQYGQDIALTWRGRWGNGLQYGQNVQWGWQEITPDPGTGNLSLPLMPPCDHWFEYEGSFNLPYHINDGYYSLLIKGCPAPEL